MKRLLPRINYWRIQPDWTGRRWYEIQWFGWAIAVGILKGNHRVALIKAAVREVIPAEFTRKQEPPANGD